MPSVSKLAGSNKISLKDRVLVIIGANGSGKTRLGSWFDESNPLTTHRISAHRSMAFPEKPRPSTYAEASSALFYGQSPLPATHPHRVNKGTRWQSKPVTGLLNDFGLLVTALLSEDYETSSKYRADTKAGNDPQPVPPTRLDVTKEIWESILPQRELLIAGGSIQARTRGSSNAYSAIEMSDGERAIFYLIGEAMCAPKNSTLVIDEPELHIHQAIQGRLWDAIEQARPDCTFIYITHDLGFAASRNGATKVWLREYAVHGWIWDEVPDTNDFPEEMLLEIMGSRKPLLFVEGERSSLDNFIYGKVYTSKAVIPCGSCEAVIHSTNSFANLAAAHHNTCRGLIDNDGRAEAEIEMLNGMGIDVLKVAIVENLLLIEPVLRLAAEKLGHDPTEKIDAVKSKVFEMLQNRRARVIASLAQREIETKLRQIGKLEGDEAAFTSAYAITFSSVDPKAIYSHWEAVILKVISDKDYGSALKYYNIKGLADATAKQAFGTDFRKQIMRWLRGKESEEVVRTLQTVLPLITE